MNITYWFIHSLS